MRSFVRHSLKLLRLLQLRGVQARGHKGRLDLLLGSALYRLIILYRVGLSPYIPPTCRFSPSCSEYALQAIARHKLFKAMRLIGWRLLRCQPFHPGGYDPVP